MAAAPPGDVVEEALQASGRGPPVGGDPGVVDGEMVRGHRRRHPALDHPGVAEELAGGVAGTVGEGAHQRVAGDHQPPGAGVVALVDERAVDGADCGGVRVGGLDEELGETAVGGGVDDHAGRGQPVAPGPTRLLVVLLEGERQAGVDDLAHRGDVDAHPEGAGGDRDPHLAAREALVGERPLLGAELGVVEHRRMARLQARGEDRRPGAGARVDDGVAVAGVDEALDPGQLLLLVAHPLGGEVEVRPRESVHRLEGIAQPEACADVAAHLLGRGRGAGDDLHRAEGGGDLADAQVVTAEVVPPLGDAVGLVHDDPAGADLVEHRPQVGADQPLGGDVEQPHPALAVGALGPALLGDVEVGVERGGVDAELPQGVDLVLHQGDERRDDERRSVGEDRGELVAERLAAAGRHHHHRVAAGEDRLDDLPLAGAEAVVAEVAPEFVEERVGGLDHPLH